MVVMFCAPSCGSKLNAKRKTRTTPSASEGYSPPSSFSSDASPAGASSFALSGCGSGTGTGWASGAATGSLVSSFIGSLLYRMKIFGVLRPLTYRNRNMANSTRPWHAPPQRPKGFPVRRSGGCRELVPCVSTTDLRNGPDVFQAAKVAASGTGLRGRSNGKM